QFRSYNKQVDGKSKLMLTVFVKEVVDDDVYKNPNNIVLSGYICKPPIYRTTPFNREIADVLVAVNRAYNKSDYIPCIALGRNARFVKNLSVGEKIAISGRIQSREYQKKLSETEVVTLTAYEVSVSKLMAYDNAEDFDIEKEFELVSYAFQKESV
ncbi:MAG: single-stranded DNA-binding protein, partial [Clostridia bacterium]|nr:single-stranded DNA-binding protein [Clostridia bacterium]